MERMDPDPYDDGPGKPVGDMQFEDFISYFWDPESFGRTTGDLGSPKASQADPSLPPVPEPLRGKRMDQVWTSIRTANSGAQEGPAGVAGRSSGSSELGRLTVGDFFLSVGMEDLPPNNPFSQVEIGTPRGPQGGVYLMEPSGRADAPLHPNRFDVSDTEPPDDSQQQRDREWQLPVSYLQPPALARMQAAGQDPSRHLPNGYIASGPQGPAGQPNGSMTTGVRPTRQRKRKEVEVVDEATDRAQKRMVKNRESAARSRQRKQQYTTDLEQQVDELKAQNRLLLERVIRACPTPAGKLQAGTQQMRRTRSGNL